ncbi:DUF885 domain-containing protein [Actinokineospora auranticolor]|uniref:Uncharacterized protein (DUF885 family) n=1 Tax=Actinokineospora auranticolor TaxID=155976 RepID=A0A2S6GG02_9PSEU|nr:DUF885 domain-containing protein [Actinokineospora auranticolor]PPK64159.1 uncharacterized protein (DUF885 family) [Actinokineospora auranticolor]
MASSQHDGVHQICDRYVDDIAAADPVTATYVGIAGYDRELPDLSPEGVNARARLAAAALAAVAGAEPADPSEANAKAVFGERVGLQVELHEAGEHLAPLNVITSAPQEVRQVFDLMPTETTEDWATISARLAGVPACLSGYRESLRLSAERGRVAALRQVTKVAEQCRTWAGLGGTSFFADLVAPAKVDDALRSDLEANARAAAESYADLAEFLTGELAAKAPTEDAVGEERYRLWSREFTGARLDLQEAYEWGWAEHARLEAEMVEVAGRIKPGATIAEAAAVLDEDPRYRVRGQRALEEWMQRLSDQALADLRGVHFEIPDPLMRLECKIAPPGGGVGAYYTGPTDDWSRPGRMWWSVPADREDFSTWREVSTVYHEGVPGHHLQIATAVYQAASLNKFQRLLTWVPAHGEGWALYAERLMREFGYLSDDGNLLGMLDAHIFRAARVIIDIGMHLKLEIPRGTGFHEGERWTPELGLEFLLTRTITDPAHVHDEIDRYLGWPGQAPTYKLGERLWLQARDEAKARRGADFDLKAFHQDALVMGAMGLDTLRERLAAL